MLVLHRKDRELSKDIEFAVKGVGVFTLLFLSACSKASSSGASSSGLTIPDVAPIVLSATPAGLKSATASSIWLRQVFARVSMGALVAPAYAANASYSNVKNSLEAIFKGSFAKVSGGQGTGYINANLQDLDTRLAEYETRFSTSLPNCFSNSLSDLTLDFANHADAKLSLKVNCRDEFAWKAGDAGAPGSGILFGKRAASGSTPELISMTLLLKHKTSAAEGGSDSYDAGFGYAGTVTGSGTSDEAVEMLFGQFNTKSGLSVSDEDQPLMARIYSKTATKEFELAVASNSGSSGSPLSGGTSYLGCGFRMKSNGTIIVIQGDYLATGTCAAGSPDTVDSCVDATTLADVSSTSAAACATLKSTQFHISSGTTSLDTFKSSVLTSNTVTTSTNIFNALKPGSTAAKAATSAMTQ